MNADKETSGMKGSDLPPITADQNSCAPDDDGRESSVPTFVRLRPTPDQSIRIQVVVPASLGEYLDTCADRQRALGIPATRSSVCRDIMEEGIERFDATLRRMESAPKPRVRIRVR